MSSSDNGAAMPPMMALFRTAGLPSTDLKFCSCLSEIFLYLASQVRVGRCGAVAVGAMAGDTNGLGNGFPLAGSAFALAPSEAWVTKLVARRDAIAAVRIIFELLMRVL